MIREYCQSPAPKTILILVIPGKVKKGHPLLKHFESLPAGAADIQEMKPLKGRSLTEWLASAVRASGKVVTPEAQRKLVEIVGSDLRRLENELEKLFTFASDRRVIDTDDVAEICDWGRTFQEWELVSSLEKGDGRQALVVLGRLFREGARPEYVLGAIAGLFRDLLLARVWRRQGQDRKEIFRTLRPKIQEFFTDYEMIFRGFFEVAEDSKSDLLGRALGELERIDTLIKSSDVPAEAMISGFVVDYCRRRRPKPGREATSGSGVEGLDLASEPGLVPGALVFVDRSLLDRFIDHRHRLRQEFLGGFLILALDGLAELFDLGAEFGFILPVDGVAAHAVALLPDGGLMNRHIILLVFAPYDRPGGRLKSTRPGGRKGAAA